MKLDQFGNRYYKVGLHIHTSRSDGRLTPEEAIQLYREHGYDAIALTDHWRYRDGETYEDFLVLSGCEYNTRGLDTISGIMHIVGIGMERDPELVIDMERQQIIDGVNAEGGIAVLAHPGWSLNTLKDSQDLHGFLATEIYNAVSEANQSIRPYSDHYVDVCANAGIYYKIFATDDTHYYDGSDECKGWVMVHAEELTREAILQALRNGDFYASQGPDLHVRREENTLIIDTSPCSYISVVSNLAWAKRTLRGDGITHFEYTIQEKEPWVRVQVCDADGKLAWSNLILRG